MDVPRVVMLSPAYPPVMGGSATYFQTLVKLLKGKASFTVLSLEAEGYPCDEMADGATVRRVLPDKRGASAFTRYLTVLPAVFSALNKEIRKGPFVLHAHSNGIYGYSASLFSKLHKVPMLKEVQDTSDRPFVLRAGRVHRWFATGKFVKDRLASFGIPEDRTVMFPTINPPVLEGLAKKALTGNTDHQGKVRFVYIGWLMNRVKGTDVLVSAFKRASGKMGGLELWMIGDGPDRQGLEMISKGSSVSFFGSLPYAEMVDRLARCDAVVLASHEEANPRCILEGYELGLPAIATDVGGVREELLDGRTGLLVKDNDVEGLSEAMLRLASDRELRVNLGIGGREFLRGLPTWKDLSERVLSEYLEMWIEVKGPDLRP